MGRKPSDQGGNNRGRIWAAIRKQNGAVFTLRGLSDAIQVHKDTVKDYIECLVKGGFVKEEARGKQRERRFSLLRDVGVDAPRVDRNGEQLPPVRTQQMWTAICMQAGGWSIQDLCLFASTEEQPVTEIQAIDYCKHLRRAGYLRQIGEQFALLPGKNTGPKAPEVQRVKRVFDPNLNQVMPIQKEPR